MLGFGESLVVPGGALYRSDAVELLSFAVRSRADFVRCNRTLLSISSHREEQLLSALDGTGSAIVWGRSETAPRVDLLLDFLVSHGLDYRMSSARQGFEGESIALYDAHSGEKAEFPAHKDEIVLTAREAQDETHRVRALTWATWHPRRLRICDSRHAMLVTRAETKS